MEGNTGSVLSVFIARLSFAALCFCLLQTVQAQAKTPEAPSKQAGNDDKSGKEAPTPSSESATKKSPKDDNKSQGQKKDKGTSKDERKASPRAPNAPANDRSTDAPNADSQDDPNQLPPAVIETQISPQLQSAPAQQRAPSVPVLLPEPTARQTIQVPAIPQPVDAVAPIVQKKGAVVDAPSLPDTKTPKAKNDPVPRATQAPVPGAVVLTPPPPEKAILAPPTGTGQGRHGFGFGGVPAINYGPDSGLGLGAIATLYWYDGKTKPYRAALTALLLFSSKGVHNHFLRLDSLHTAGLPLRIEARLGYYSSVAQPYCGVGNTVTCDPAEASAVRAALGLTGQPATDFERHYYLHRYIRPYGWVNGRWMLRDKPHRVEFFAGARANYYLPGQLVVSTKALSFDGTPYAGSRFASDHPQGEQGLASVLQVGVLVDNRNREITPTNGYTVETSLRAATPLWGSQWSFAGVNITARAFLPLNRTRTVVLASRFVGDVVVDASTFGALAGQESTTMPVQEMVRVGGLTDYRAFGGEWMGRGIRAQRFVGRIKAMQQTELRWAFLHHSLLDKDADWSALAFMDTGLIGLSVSDFGGNPLHPNLAGGVGLRFIFDRNFVVRGDLAVSPEEGYRPRFYLGVDHTF